LTGAASTSGVCNVIDVRDATSKIARKTADLRPVLDKRNTTPASMEDGI
jgi:hypothetical protein